MSGPRLLGAVLAGGASRRLGRDKAAEPVGGMRLIDRAVEALRPRCGEVVVVSSRDDTPSGAWMTIMDARPPCGPLGGIEAALLHASENGYDAVFVLAVDLPFFGGEGVARIVQEFGTSGSRQACRSRAAAAARDGDPGFEPLCAVYGVDCLPAVTGLLDDGERAARVLFERVGGVRVAHVPGSDLNVNRPADLREARERTEERI